MTSPPMRAELLRHGLYDCHGWAYQPCDQLAKWILIEHWPNHSWAATGLCQKHAADVFAGSEDEYRPPLSRTWWNVVDFERFGDWPH